MLMNLLDFGTYFGVLAKILGLFLKKLCMK
jgi:hypothetical protein